MTDMHCHILPCVDDGAGSVEEACSMAWKAWENGTKRIIATPHFCRPDQRRRRSVQEYRRYVYLLQQGLRELGCGLELRAGMEVFATAELPKLLDRQEVLTLADSRYLLVEFYFDERGDYMDDALRLVADRGYEGFVVKPAGALEEIRALPPERPGEKGRLEAGGAALLSRLSKAALDQGLTGLEFAQGIPGSVGGGVTMNAGAYGGETAQVLLQVTALERDGTQRLLSRADCGLSYRHSRFSKGDLLICRAVFALPEGTREEIAGRMADFAQRRREKQPLEYPSAGSTFKRPQGHFAAALIDQCGLKGRAVGGAQVSEKHAGFLINRGGATCADVLELADQVRQEVLRQTGVELELEIRVLG